VKEHDDQPAHDTEFKYRKALEMAKEIIAKLTPMQRKMPIKEFFNDCDDEEKPCQ